MNKDKTITELLYRITQKNSTVKFTDDFSGMLTVSYNSAEGLEHQHLSYPGGSMKELEKSLVKFLGTYLEELENV